MRKKKKNRRRVYTERKKNGDKVMHQCFYKCFESPRLQMQLRCTAAKFFEQRPPAQKPANI